MKISGSALRCALLAFSFFALNSSAQSGEWPAVSDLKVQKELPDPLVMFDGKRIETAQAWRDHRRPELKELFQHYMYGYFPAAPKQLHFEVEQEPFELFDGKAEAHEVAIRLGNEPSKPDLHLLIILPTKVKGRVPLFLGINFCGNHALIPDKRVRLTESWVYDSCGGQNHQAVEASRGSQFNDWGIDTIIDRGYGFAAFHSADVDPDVHDFTDGLHPHFFKKGQTEPGPQDWGTIAAWAWGAQRAVDYLVTLSEVNKDQIALIGHSRLGKTTLLAAAYDERIALAIPHQAGCGGTSPNRFNVGESVERINRVFPHWFNDTFPLFNEEVERLPFDQHCLVALMAPRPVLLSNAVEDQWADPDGQFNMLKAAHPVYELLQIEGLGTTEKPGLGQPVLSKLGFYERAGNHSMTRGDWQVFLDFADRHFGRK